MEPERYVTYGGMAAQREYLESGKAWDLCLGCGNRLNMRTTSNRGECVHCTLLVKAYDANVGKPFYLVTALERRIRNLMIIIFVLLFVVLVLSIQLTSPY